MIVIPKKDKIETDGFDRPTRTLSKDKKYYVLAIEKSLSKHQYYLMDDTNMHYPMAYKSSLFRVVDPSVSPDWVSRKSGLLFKKEFQSFPEWANDLGRQNHPGFYERLVDADPGDVENVIMSRYISAATGAERSKTQ